MDPPSANRQLAKPAAPYTSKAPSPPRAYIAQGPQWLGHMKIVPRYDNIDPAFLTRDELAIITQNGVSQVSVESFLDWTYGCRRQAQRVLDHLYLGPAMVLRDRQWLQEQGITMVLAVRDAKQAEMNLMNADKIEQELGIEARYIDVTGYHELVHAFPSAARVINEHMLRIYREQAITTANEDMGEGTITINESEFRRGKVLVYCETGNERSAAIVAAYLMVIFGVTAIKASQFVTHSRFCVSMDEGSKQALTTFEGVLQARRMVHQHELQSGTASMPKKAKRGVDDTIDDDEDTNMTGIDRLEHQDEERFVGRSAFVPFLED